MHAVGISRSPRFVGTSVFVEDNLLPLMVGAMIGAVVGLGYRAGQRRGYGPLAVGILSASMLLLGRFVVVSDVMMYLGGGMLIIASVWNSWPRERATTTVVELEFPCNLDSHSTEN